MIFIKINRNYLLRAWRKRTVKSNTKLSKILGEKNEAPCDDATSDFECGRSRSITKGFLPTIKLVNLSTGGRAEFAPKLCIAYWPQTYCNAWMARRIRWRAWGRIWWRIGDWIANAWMARRFRRRVGAWITWKFRLGMLGLFNGFDDEIEDWSDNGVLRGVFDGFD